MYVDVNGNGYQNYEQACIIHGCDTPAQLKARGGPAYSFKADPDDPF